MKDKIKEEYETLQFFVDNYGRNEDIFEVALTVKNRNFKDKENELHTRISTKEIYKGNISPDSIEHKIISFFEDMLLKIDKNTFLEEDIKQFYIQDVEYNGLSFNIFLSDSYSGSRQFIIRFRPDEKTNFGLKKEIERLKYILFVEEEKNNILGDINISDCESEKKKRM